MRALYEDVASRIGSVEFLYLGTEGTLAVSPALNYARTRRGNDYRKKKNNKNSFVSVIDQRVIIRLWYVK